MSLCRLTNYGSGYEIAGIKFGRCLHGHLFSLLPPPTIKSDVRCKMAPSSTSRPSIVQSSLKLGAVDANERSRPVDDGAQEPKQKRRRVGRGSAEDDIASFLDVEAQVVGSDEEDVEDDETDGFIDDAGSSDGIQVPWLYPQLARRSPSLEPEAIAQRIQERDSARRAASLAGATDDIDDMVDALSPIYDVSVHPWLRYELSQFLKSLPGVVRIVQPRSTLLRDHLYVECRDRHALVKALFSWPQAHRTSRAQKFPVLLGLTDRQAVAPSSVPSLRSNYALTGVWARLRETGDMYYQDLLAMIADDDDPLHSTCESGDRLALVIPRIEFDYLVAHPPDHRPPPGLFTFQQVADKYPENNRPTWAASLQLWMWGKSAYRDSGLSVIKIPPSHNLLTSDVLPTDDELALFSSSFDYDLDRPSLVSWVLQLGDRVIVVEAKTGEFMEFAGATGYIIEMHANTAIILPDHVHTQQTEDEGPTAAAATREGHFSIPLSLLRLHLLATPPMLSIGDRVGILRGPHFGVHGRIVEFSGAFANVLPLEGDLICVELADARINVRLGDVVEVTRGAYQGAVGFIVALCVGGYVELYVSKMGRALELQRNNVSDTMGSDHISVKVRTLDLKFTFMEAAGRWTMPSTTQPSVVDQQRQRDRDREVWEKDMRTIGRLLRDVEVRIVKGHDKKGRDQPLLRLGDSIEEILADAELIVILEFDGSRVEIGVDNVVERHDFPLAQAALFKLLGILDIFIAHEKTSQPEPDIEKVAENDVSWGAVVPSLLPPVELQVLPPDVGETTGVWLTIPKLVNKRVDLVMVSVAELREIEEKHQQLKKDKKINSRTYDMAKANRPGYLTPLIEPVRFNGVARLTVKCNSAWQQCNRPYNHTATLPANARRLCERNGAVYQCGRGAGHNHWPGRGRLSRAHRRVCGDTASHLGRTLDIRQGQIPEIAGDGCDVQSFGVSTLIVCVVPQRAIPGYEEETCPSTDFAADPPPPPGLWVPIE
ncbi:hypothetical protein GGX14DRAFT_581068 [Mycena pura]|uniref:KOW domain-containing protein n=1 Tax=Mycena pura TaxID=153505 RepID=A0AAD6UK56_9AGAR|nr:hypothetical protein GGX14DRAFT_581068 [Mycena pura]